jgi:hypothetical protein
MREEEIKKGRHEVSLFVCWGLFTTLLVLVRELASQELVHRLIWVQLQSLLGPLRLLS